MMVPGVRGAGGGDGAEESTGFSQGRRTRRAGAPCETFDRSAASCVVEGTAEGVDSLVHQTRSLGAVEVIESEQDSVS